MVSSRQPGDAASISQAPSQPVQDMSMRQPSVNQVQNIIYVESPVG